MPTIGYLSLTLVLSLAVGWCMARRYPMDATPHLSVELVLAGFLLASGCVGCRLVWLELDTGVAVLKAGSRIHAFDQPLWYYAIVAFQYGLCVMFFGAASYFPFRRSR